MCQAGETRPGPAPACYPGNREWRARTARSAYRRHAAGPVPHPFEAGVRRDGRGLQGRTRAAGPRRGGEVPAPLDRRPEDVPQPVRERSEGDEPAAPPALRLGHRLRRRGFSVPGHGFRDRPDVARSDAGGPYARGARDASRAAAAGGPGPRARAGHRPPRPQTRESDPERGGGAEGAPAHPRLRPREAARRPADDGGHGGGHAQLHVARAVRRGRRDRRPHGSVHGRHRAVRDVRRAQAVPVGERRRGDPDAARVGAAQAAQRRRRVRATRRSWRRCSTRRCRSCPRIASSRRPSWPRRWRRRRRGRRRARRWASWPQPPEAKADGPKADAKKADAKKAERRRKRKARTEERAGEARAGRDGPTGRKDDDRHRVGGAAANGGERGCRGRRRPASPAVPHGMDRRAVRRRRVAGAADRPRVAARWRRRGPARRRARPPATPRPLAPRRRRPPPRRATARRWSKRGR